MDEDKNIDKKTNLPKTSAFFEGNHLYAFLYKKAEKLSSAIYMVTNFIPENEKLRGLLRDKSINIFSEIARLQKMSLTQYETSRTNESIESRRNSLYIILSGITETLSYIEILHSSGYISEMNFTILKREYIELGELIKNRKDDIALGDMHLKDNFFDVPDLYKTYTLRHSVPKKESKKGIIHQAKKTKSATVEEGNIKEPQRVRRAKIHIGTAKVRHNDRRNSILELLQSKSPITIKDTEEAVKGCSAKTLQRELLSLVSEGILKKKGERRWSTYSLA